LRTEERDDPTGTNTKIVSNVVITLKTSKGTKQLKLDPSMYENLNR
jgi:RuvB-like protein 1 (pontin 52)